MPIYEFECKKCGERFEILLLNSREKAVCPHCSSRRVRRLISGFAVHGGRSGAGSSASACPTCTTKTCSGCQ